MLQLYPPEFIAHRLKFKINMFKIVIKNEQTMLVNIEFDKTHFEFFNRPSSGNIFAKCDLDSLAIFGKNQLVLLKGKERERQFLSFKFEMNPLDKQFDFGVELTMKSSYLLYDIETINQLYRMLKPPDVSIEELQSYAQYKLTDLKQMTALSIEFALERHKQLKLNIKVEPSFVIVPKLGDIAKANSVVLLSLGE